MTSIFIDYWQLTACTALILAAFAELSTKGNYLYPVTECTLHMSITTI